MSGSQASNADSNADRSENSDGNKAALETEHKNRSNATTTENSPLIVNHSEVFKEVERNANCNGFDTTDTRQGHIPILKSTSGDNNIKTEARLRHVPIIKSKSECYNNNTEARKDHVPIIKSKSEDASNTTDVHKGNVLVMKSNSDHAKNIEEEQGESLKKSFVDLELTKTRSCSVVEPTSSESRDAHYQSTPNAQALTGHASLTGMDLILVVPPAPIQPPRLLQLGKETMQRASSTPNIANRSPSLSPDSPSAHNTGSLLRVKKQRPARLPVDGVNNDSSGSEESSVEWSDDDDDRSIHSASSISADSFYETLAIRDSQLIEKVHRIALELTTTEHSYVQKLAILDEARRKSEGILGKDIARQIFPNIQSMYTLHKDNMLPHLKERLTNWHTQPQIGDIMKLFSPYLKMYTDYVKNFDNALSLVGTWNAKNAEFSKMLHSLTPNGVSLTLKLQLKAHMLEPVQRVPRYKLLLQQYLKEIPEGCTEYTDIQVALASVTQAAQEFEERMEHGMVVGELADLQRHIDCPISLISSTRKLVRQGRIGKVNATTGKVVDRYIFLFNDLFLLCGENNFMTFYFYKYKVRQLMEIDGMQVVNGDNLDIQYTFYIKTKKKTVELCASNEKELESWQEILKQTIDEKVRRKLSKSSAVNQRRTMICIEETLGKKAPIWINNSQVSMCMICGATFSLLKKKHHCRACGVVTCHGCSRHSAPLEYDDMAVHRVCDECYLLLHDTGHKARQPSALPLGPRTQEPCVLKGFLEFSMDNGYSWKRRWLQLHSDKRLYCYKAQQDINPLVKVQLTECTIDTVTVVAYGHPLIRIISNQKPSRKTFLLRGEKKEPLTNWIVAFQKLSISVAS